MSVGQISNCSTWVPSPSEPSHFHPTLPSPTPRDRVLLKRVGAGKRRGAHRLPHIPRPGRVWQIGTPGEGPEGVQPPPPPPPSQAWSLVVLLHFGFADLGYARLKNAVYNIFDVVPSPPPSSLPPLRHPPLYSPALSGCRTLDMAHPTRDTALMESGCRAAARKRTGRTKDLEVAPTLHVTLRGGGGAVW